ncbi:MAG: class I mannose-6-phosphate isomerase [Myxococcales bacterium]|nr:class I mannose-6-phosphate isomerase [Myxococcales bacterium]
MSLHPRRLRADNFTPPERTPWGGTKIPRVLKAGLGLDVDASRVVGEAWEISVEPSFPSRDADSDERLDEVIATDPEGWLGPKEAARGQTSLLVKLLDAADDLSVQVHPADDDPALAPDESGKPEAWIVLFAEPGAGLYLGFREGVGRAEVEACLREGGRLDELMTFVTVEPGDAFVIEAGTPHAIGAGVTLVEPQLVRPGRRGLTYRFWDWNRRYDASGKRDAKGEPRELHVERSLAVTTWEGPRGEAFVARCRAVAKRMGGEGLVREQVVGWPWFGCERWRGEGALDLQPVGGLLAVTVVRGRMTLEGRTGKLRLAAGESGVVPAAAGGLRVEGEDLLAFATTA